MEKNKLFKRNLFFISIYHEIIFMAFGPEISFFIEKPEQR